MNIPITGPLAEILWKGGRILLHGRDYVGPRVFVEFPAGTMDHTSEPEREMRFGSYAAIESGKEVHLYLANWYFTNKRTALKYHKESLAEDRASQFRALEQKRKEERFEAAQAAEKKLEEYIRKQFTELTGLEAAEVSQALPIDRNCAVHTESRTWECRLTLKGKIENESFKELK